MVARIVAILSCKGKSWECVQLAGEELLSLHKTSRFTLFIQMPISLIVKKVPFTVFHPNIFWICIYSFIKGCMDFILGVPTWLCPFGACWLIPKLAAVIQEVGGDKESSR